jgi:hypothetical protein
MIYIKTVLLSASEARNLAALGFVLELKTIGKLVDLYHVFVR